MKQMLTRVVFSMFALAFVAVAAPAYADATVGVVNVQKIMKESKAAQSVRSQILAKEKAYQTDLDAKKKELDTEGQALAKEQETTKDKAAFEAKVKDFRAKAASVQRDVDTKKAALDKAFAGALEQIQGTVMAVVKEVAGEKKMNLVVSSSQVLYSDATMDVTDDVLKRLDAKLPSVSVKF